MTQESPAPSPWPGKPEGRRAVRLEGPTPHGGAYMIVYYRDDGESEYVEFDSSDRPIMRTVPRTRRAVEASGPDDEDAATEDSLVRAGIGEDGVPWREKVEQPDFSDEDFAAADRAAEILRERWRTKS